MRRIVLMFIVVVLLVPLMFGAATECPEQTWKDPSAYSYGLDPNEIAIDPDTGEPALLGVVTGEIGSGWHREGDGCDPDGDAMVFTAECSIEVVEPNYIVAGTIDQIGPVYYDITVTDVPADPNQTAKSVTGTLVVVGLPVNQRPRLFCGGQP